MTAARFSQNSDPPNHRTAVWSRCSDDDAPTLFQTIDKEGHSQMTLENLHDLMIHELKDLYSAEKQLLKALPKMVKAANDGDLRKALTRHLEETREHVDRLEQAFNHLDVSTRGAKCEAMAGLIEEGEKLMKEDAAPAVMDAGLICAAQRVEHYEIAGYGCAHAFADLMNHREVARLLKQTLEEESNANETLTAIAEQRVNQQALEAESAEIEA
jgi:ferritin-like metal-binding protein YciE